LSVFKKEQKVKEPKTCQKSYRYKILSRMKEIVLIVEATLLRSLVSSMSTNQYSQEWLLQNTSCAVAEFIDPARELKTALK